MNITFCGEKFLLDASGALLWVRKRMLIVADAHLEKGSHYAQRGYFLPPYDSHMTLERLANTIEKTAAQKILILGDFFHDNDAHKRLSVESLRLFDGLRRFPLIWVKGNHDVGYRPAGIDVFDEFSEDGIFFRHEATADGIGEISGHFHPKSEFIYKGRRFGGRCFVEDGRKFMLPAFGAYTGGLSVQMNVIRSHFGETMRHYIAVNDRVIQVPDLSDASG